MTDITTTIPATLDPAVFPASDMASATKSIDVSSIDFAKVGQYRLELRVFFTDESSGPEAIKTFLVDVIDYCVPTLSKSTPPGDITYTLGRAPESSSFAPWTVVPLVCNFSYAMTVVAANPGGGMVTFDETSRTISVTGSDVFYSGDHTTGTYTPGVYSVEIRGWGDNSHDTNTFDTITVTILDPCDPDLTGTNVPNVTILGEIVSPDPILYQILDPTDMHTLTASALTVTESETSVTCPEIKFSVTNLDYSTPLDSIFTWTWGSQEL